MIGGKTGDYDYHTLSDISLTDKVWEQRVDKTVIKWVVVVYN